MKRRIVALVLAGVLISAAACGDSGSSTATGKTFETDARVALNAYTALVEQHLSSTLTALASVAVTNDAQLGQWSSIQPALAQLASRSETDAAVWFVRTDGSYYTVEQGLVNANLSDRPYFPRLMAGQDVLADLVVSKATGKMSAIVATPIRAGGVVVGGLGASVDLSAVTDIVSRTLRLPSNIVFYALDPEGKTALHSDTMHIFEFPSQEGSPTLTNAVEQMLQNPEGSVSYTYNGEKTVVFKRSKVTNWVFALGTVGS